MDEVKLVESVRDIRKKIEDALARDIVGQKDVIEQLLIALFARGHVLIVGVPGLAKTMIVKALCNTMSLQFGRIQFTPDLMPSDITGTDILSESKEGLREFRFLKGPLFCNLLLADELNRTPPKTQAALLQAMQEGAVTAGGRTFELPKPFMVFATQNPIEQAGTYPLPEAQLDRFMFQVHIDYPGLSDELEIVRQTTVEVKEVVKSVVSIKEVIDIQNIVPKVPCADHIIEGAVKLTRMTRPGNDSPDFVNESVRWGAGPRAAQMLIYAAKARAVLLGRYAVDFEDVAALSKGVLRHRIILNFDASSKGITPDSIIEKLVAKVRP
jgi:MoxR-like ATPase